MADIDHPDWSELEHRLERLIGYGCDTRRATAVGKAISNAAADPHGVLAAITSLLDSRDEQGLGLIDWCYRADRERFLQLAASVYRRRLN